MTIGDWPTAARFTVITGFNTDVEHQGVVYHVQTEDKGLDTPLILTLVYSGGAILASKRTFYEDLKQSGFDEAVLNERLQRQHKLVCAAIRSGRIDDLRKMSEREAAHRIAAKALHRSGALVAQEQEARDAANADQTPLTLPDLDMPSLDASETLTLLDEDIGNDDEAFLHSDQLVEPDAAQVQERESSLLDIDIHTTDSGLPELSAEIISDFARAEIAAEVLKITLLEDKELRGGDRVSLRVQVGRGPAYDEGVMAAEVLVKVLGSTFRPLSFQSKTGANGVATIRMQLPHFTTGRAAILVRALADGDEAELRRIIHQG